VFIVSMGRLDFINLRKEMVERLKRKGITNDRILEVFKEIPREHFVPLDLIYISYADMPISSRERIIVAHPWITALMLQSLDIGKEESVLELGTNSGYQTAILSRLARKVMTCEEMPDMAMTASLRLRSEYKNVHLYKGGKLMAGLPMKGPFDKIISNVPISHFPKALMAQLREGGSMMFPVKSGSFEQITILNKTEKGIVKKKLIKLQYISLPEAEGVSSENKPSGPELPRTQQLPPDTKEE
jgi:protein-L-isoaspartate(D-aspartate) O-methyltransferase